MGMVKGNQNAGIKRDQRGVARPVLRILSAVLHDAHTSRRRITLSSS